MLEAMQKNNADLTKESDTQALFGAADITPRTRPTTVSKSSSAAAVRLREPNRKQIELRAQDLESLLGEGHRARLVWGYVVKQDLRALHAKIMAREGLVGRNAIDPRVLFALWLYATLEGVGSAREVARLTQEHDA